MDNNEVLFSVETPLEFVVTVAKQRWELIVTQKHPALAGQEELVRDALSAPDEIRRSRTDESVYLFYKVVKPKRWVCAVVNCERGFIIMAYPTDAIKEGEVIWTK